MKKLGLVLEGGGIRGAYTAGALAWLHDQHIHFDYGVGISSGAIYLVLYWDGQEKLAYDLATKYSIAPEIVGLKALVKEGHYVAYKRLFEHYLCDVGHFNGKNLVKKNAPVEVGCYVLEHGQTEYFPVDENLQTVLGSASLPIAAKVIEYQGLHLLDGGVTKMIPIERAMEQGCTHTLVITTKARDYVRKPASLLVKMLMKVVYRSYPQMAKDYALRHINYYKQRQLIDDYVKKGQAVNIYPTVNVPVSRWKGSAEQAKQLYELGYSDMENRKEEIMELIKEED
ncbi:MULTISPECIES: patatin family protein [Terrabacteria group]|uniref:patatin-like phospholipase family protein n=1 Tax=Bacillati TaxID=1783272 RepID=UPI001C6ED3DD|nr:MULTISPECIES: patatin family protein [Terrabacteria group]MBW9212857.1 patatin family protein [Trueperella sp. zg.1013]